MGPRGSARLTVAGILLSLLAAPRGARGFAFDAEVTGRTGSNVTLPCISTGDSIISQITWLMKTASDPVVIASRSDGRTHITDGSFTDRLSFLGVTNKAGSISISALRAADDGIYVCRLTRFSNTPEEKVIKLNVLATPAVSLTLDPRRLVSGLNASRPVATCVAANGRPAANISWSLTNASGVEFVLDFREASSVVAVDSAAAATAGRGGHGRGGLSTVTSVLRLDPSKEMNGATLACVVTQPLSDQRITKALALDVLYKPRVLVSSDDVRVTHEGAPPITLRCAADANPSAEYSWTRNGWPVPGGDRGVLVLPRTVTSSGSYRCSATNGVGTDAAGVEVTVAAAPAQPTGAPPDSQQAGGSSRLMIIGIASGVSVIIMIIAIVASVLIKRRIKKRSTPESGVIDSSTAGTAETEITYAVLDREALQRTRQKRQQQQRQQQHQQRHQQHQQQHQQHQQQQQQQGPGAQEEEEERHSTIYADIAHSR